MGLVGLVGQVGQVGNATYPTYLTHPTYSTYSARSASSGAIRVARRAGRYAASVAESDNTIAAVTRTIGSTGLTCYSRLLDNLPMPAASNKPIARPTIVVRMPSRTMSFWRSCAVAPSAMRMPISRVRRDTSYALRP